MATERKKERTTIQPENNCKQDGNCKSLSIITLNINVLNSVIKRHRMAEWIKKKNQDPTRCTEKIHFIFRDTHRLKVKGWKRIFHANEN